MCAPYGGPTNYLNGGISRGSPDAGAFAMWYQKPFLRGFAMSPGGAWWVLYGRDISHDPYDGSIEGSGPGPYFPGTRDPIALVPDAVTSARASSWGAPNGLHR